jgi:sec-independent protein translocase protein TatA
MGATSLWHWIILGLIVVLLFGRGKVSELMGDVAKGIKAFKNGMAEDEKKPDDAKKDPKIIDNAPAKGAEQASADKTKVG